MVGRFARDLRRVADKSRGCDEEVPGRMVSWRGLVGGRRCRLPDDATLARGVVVYYLQLHHRAVPLEIA